MKKYIFSIEYEIYIAPGNTYGNQVKMIKGSNTVYDERLEN